MTSRVQHIQEPPSVYFIPLSSPPSRLSIPLAHPTHGFFTLFVDFSPHPQVTALTVCAEIHGWMGGLHETRATGGNVRRVSAKGSPYVALAQPL